MVDEVTRRGLAAAVPRPTLARDVALAVAVAVLRVVGRGDEAEETGDDDTGGRPLGVDATVGIREAVAKDAEVVGDGDAGTPADDPPAPHPATTTEAAATTTDNFRVTTSS
ncbi:hypothetical protein [Acidipropionibacterium timonense]|uniref:hypothetical protein n=1 Tax=Acidipropionibacterium timonense TaxID=2161818 RepID=UPI001AEC161D|nr:hypothetical protein [Acidipropionibacterium timonense]